jgi:hypothetical protein
MASKKDEPKRNGLRPGRRQSGLRIPDDTLRAVAIAAAERDLPKWKMADTLLRKALGMEKRPDDR